jgi:serine/threonine protein kinase
MVQSQSTQPLGGRYQVIQALGVGGFGHTFLAQDLHLPGHPRCVVKQLKPLVNSPKELQVARRLFDTEAQVLYRLGSHGQIPGLLAHFEDHQEFYLAQDYVEGQDLEMELATQPPWTDGEAISFLQDLLTTLAFVHDHGVIHRDIKPSNLIRRHSDHRLVLIDFGAVKQVGSRLTTIPSSLNRTISIGTQGYMPSEQLAGRPQFSSDIYAVGMIAIQGLTGHQPNTIAADPHSGELDWHGLAPHCHPALVTLLDYMVQYDFRSRYSTAAAALAALQTVFPQAEGAFPSPSRGLPTVAVGRPPDTTTRSPRTTVAPGTSPRRRSRSGRNSLLPLGLGVLVLGGLGLITWRILLALPAATVETVASPAPVTEARSEDAPATARVELPPETGLAPEPVPTPMPELEPTDRPEPEASAPEAVDPDPDVAVAPTPLTPEAAQATVASLYDYLSNQSWDAARGVFGKTLAQQFDPGFFQQFEQVTVDNLQVTHQTTDTVELTGQNTYIYPDGSRQREERTYTVQSVDGQPRIVASAFVQVLAPRGADP